MTGRVFWHRLAEQDLTAAVLLLATESPQAAERLLDAVEEAIRILVENPSAGRARDFRSPRAAEIRSWAVRGFRSYLVFYRSEERGLAIVRFVHGARDLDRLLDEEP